MVFERDYAALLAFFAEAGVDVLLGEEPVDRFAEQPAPRPSAVPPALTAPGASALTNIPEAATAQGATNRARQTAPAAPRFALGGDGSPAADAPPAPDAAIMAAREAVRNAQDLDALRAILERFEGCALRATARRLVFADGNPRSRIMFVGEAPGREEDLEGLPFVGPSGRFLDRMLAAIGLDRTNAYIGNVIPWRPPGNRTPTPQETATCLPFIRRQIELADPDILVCLGVPSAQALLGVKEAIRKVRGHWHVYHTGTREIRAIATFHPAFLLRSPLEKRLAWRDFLAVKTALAK